MDKNNVASDGDERLIELLYSLRPNYGDIGSRDVDVTATRTKIEAAIELLAARTAPADKPARNEYVDDNGTTRCVSCHCNHDLNQDHGDDCWVARDAAAPGVPSAVMEALADARTTAMRKQDAGNVLIPVLFALDAAIHKVLIAGGDCGDELSDTDLRNALEKAQHVAYRALISIGIDRIPGAVNPLSALLPATDRLAAAPTQTGGAA